MIVGNPVISVPCGFTDDGVPIGLQIVGRHRDDLSLLQMAFAYESARGAVITEDMEGTGSKRRNGETKVTEGRRALDSVEYF